MTNAVPAARRRSAERVEGVDVEEDAEVGHRDVVVVDRIAAGVAAALGDDVGHELVAVEVPVDPRLGLAPLRAPERAAVEPPGGGEVVDGDGEVEPWPCHGVDATDRGFPDGGGRSGSRMRAKPSMASAVVRT